MYIYTFVVFSPPSAAKPQWLQQIDVICAECASAGWCHRIPHSHASSRRPGKAITSATVEISWDVWHDTIIMNQYMIQYDIYIIWYNHIILHIITHLSLYEVTLKHWSIRFSWIEGWLEVSAKPISVVRCQLKLSIYISRGLHITLASKKAIPKSLWDLMTLWQTVRH